MEARKPARNFRDLEIWQLGKQIALEVYRATKTFPSDERFELVAQMRSAAISIPSNIAEGFNRYHNKEYRQFLFVSLGSCGELETQVEISGDLGFLSDDTRCHLTGTIAQESRMIRSLIGRLT